MYCVKILFSLFFLMLMSKLNVSFKIWTGDTTDKLDECVVRVIDKLFGSENVVYFIFENNATDFLPYGIVNPRVIINATKQNKMHILSQYKIKSKSNYKLLSTEYSQNFVIQTENIKSLRNILSYLTSSAIWNHYQSPRGTLLVITEAVKPQLMFPVLWNLFIRRAVILVHNRNKPQNIHRLYTANSHELGNNCGLIAKVYSIKSCKDPALKFDFKNPLRNYGKCAVHFDDNGIFKSATSKKVVTLRATIDTLRSYCNVSTVLTRSPALCIMKVVVSRSNYLEHYQLSYIYYQTKWFFVVPVPDRIEGLELFIFIFQEELWILVLVSFFVTAVVWILILRHKKNYILGNISSTFLNVFSITLWGSSCRTPKTFAVRCLFASYLIYSIHIQTAYVSMIINVLTIPQFEKGIRTLQELADSDLPFCLVKGYVNMQFSQNIPEHEIYTKLKNKMRPDHINGVYSILTYIEQYNNCSTASLEDYIFLWENFYNKSLSNTRIEGNAVMGPYTYRLRMEQGHYFIDTINQIIVILTESGIYRKLENDVDVHYRKLRAERTTDFQPTVLGLGHLFGVFVIWGVGNLLSVMVFLIELMISKWYCST